MFTKNRCLNLVLVSLIALLTIFSALAADALAVDTSASADSSDAGALTDAEIPVGAGNTKIAGFPAGNLSSAVTSCIYYFYAKECENCLSLDAYFPGLALKYPKLQVEKFEVYHNYQNYKLLQDYFTAYKVKEKNIPVVFTSGSYFIGSQSITSFLEETIKSSPNAPCPSLEEKPIGIIGAGEPLNVLNTLNFISVTQAAAKNIFTPGIIALVLILLAIVTLIEEREDLLKKGGAFIAGVYLAYVLYGVGLFNWFNNYSLYLYFYKLVGFAAILFAIVGINAFFKSVNSLVKKVPEEYSENFKSAAALLLSYPGVFLIGFISALFTFAGVNNTFILLRDVFAGFFMKPVILPLICYYGLVLILIFIVLLTLFNFIRQKVEEHAARNKISDVKETLWKKHYVKILNFLIRALMLILGLVLVFI